MEKEGWVQYEDDVEIVWDHFVEAHPHGRLSHLIGFKKTVASVYGLKPNYWLYRKTGRILAVFPSFFHRGLIYGRRLVSQPFSEYGGLLFSPELKTSEKLLILNEFPKVIESSQKRGCFDYLELRCFSDIPVGSERILRKKCLYAYGILDLGEELNLWRAVDSSVRKNLRRARSYELALEEAKERLALEGIFYPLYLQTLKRLGSPPHPLLYFLSLHENLKEKMKLFLARWDGAYVSALLGWAVGKSVHITDIASNEKFFHLRANDFLHFELIQWARAHGFQYFDFGPIRYRGQRQYKKKWGVKQFEYAYYYYPPEKIPRLLSDRSLAARVASACWKILIPTCLASRIGKYLRKELSL